MTDEQLKALVLSIADRWRETPFSYCGGYPDMVTLGHDELHRLVAKVRADALEEAAKACEKHIHPYPLSANACYEHCAEEIRSLK